MFNKVGITYFLDDINFDSAVEMESAGFDSLWVSEHVFFHGPCHDGLSLLAYMAGITSTVALGTAVHILPLRPPAAIARQAATVDLLSKGRLILGVGVGGEFPKEFEACGVSVTERGARTDESIGVLRRLWTEDDVEHSGRFYRLPGVTLNPKPAQTGGPPIWIAGRSEAAMKRAARVGDAYMPYLVSPQQFTANSKLIASMVEQNGRAKASVKQALYQFICVSDDDRSARTAAAVSLASTYQQPFDHVLDKYVVFGPPSKCLDRLWEYATAGVDEIVLVPIAADGGSREHTRENIATEILPHLRTRRS